MQTFRFCGQHLSSPEPNLLKVSFCDDCISIFPLSVSQQMLKRTSWNGVGII